MKACKYCKKSIANNAKTCKYCKKPVNNKTVLQRKKMTSKDEIKKTVADPKTIKKNRYNRIIEEEKKRNELEKQKRLKQQEKKLKRIETSLEHKEDSKLKNKNQCGNQPKNKNLKEKLNFKKTNKLKQDKPSIKVEKSNETEIVKEIEVLNDEEINKQVLDNKKGNNEVTISNFDKLKKISGQKKIVFIILVCLAFLFIAFGIKWMQTLTNNGPTTEITEKNRGQIFNMNEKINYKGMNYQIVSVERSSGTVYKTPKEGHEFIIVTLRLENASDEKLKYSNKSWKIKNSTGKETSKIFLPIKGQQTLYSDSLVIGAQKTGYLVFEQPKDEKQLELNFYDEKDIEANEKLSAAEQKKLEKMFGFKIKVNSNKEAIIED